MVFPFGKSFLFFCFSVCLCKILFILDSSDRKNLQIHRIVRTSADSSCPAGKLCLRIVVKSVNFYQGVSGHAVRCPVSAARNASSDYLGIIADRLCEHGKYTCEIVAVSAPFFIDLRGIVIFPAIVYLKCSPGAVIKPTSTAHVVISSVKLFPFCHAGVCDLFQDGVGFFHRCPLG